MVIKSLVDPSITLGIILDKHEFKPGIDFLTDTSEPIQVATFRHDFGKVLLPHRHIERKRMVDKTQEVLFVVSGSCMLDIYDLDDKMIFFQRLTAGRGYISLYGGVGYKVLEKDTKMVEVKTGTYEVESDDEDRVRI